ncbi:hypothetical protein DPMN_194512 [Dreissena polymorpha]|uniref:Uncharacterized protein n=1 Tax=Dreissena polymorpha TaxID=45954 RepID=A0A9D3Y6B0_DREPO|nr:hypothetical protein DPMN_194512 [Dreissena polymorpha]
MKRKLEAEQAGKFPRQYNKMLPYCSCNKCCEDHVSSSQNCLCPLYQHQQCDL